MNSLESHDYCSQFLDYSINNIKGDCPEDRFIDVISDPNNLFIKRCEKAGTIEDDCVILHNGIKVLKNSYYDDFSRILVINKGCHEPAEERMFELILRDIPENGTMIELGSYWAFYTIWFNSVVKNAKNYCIEPLLDNLITGVKNCSLNNINNVDFTLGAIGREHINICDFIREKKIDYIDILHSDIQGYELEMLQDITELLIQNKIKYLFISTHSDFIHYMCINILKKNNYRIIASADFETETFCFDGIIVACHVTNQKFGNYNLGTRKYTKLRDTPTPY
jgi:hypothetical protein